MTNQSSNKTIDIIATFCAICGVVFLFYFNLNLISAQISNNFNINIPMFVQHSYIFGDNVEIFINNTSDFEYDQLVFSLKKKAHSENIIFEFITESEKGFKYTLKTEELGLENGNYEITVTATYNNQTTESKNIFLEINNLKIDFVKPSETSFTINDDSYDFQVNLSQENTPVDFYIYDESNNLLDSFSGVINTNDTNISSKNYDISSLNNGDYVLKAEANNTYTHQNAEASIAFSVDKNLNNSFEIIEPNEGDSFSEDVAVNIKTYPSKANIAFFTLNCPDAMPSFIIREGDEISGNTLNEFIDIPNSKNQSCVLAINVLFDNGYQLTKKLNLLIDNPNHTSNTDTNSSIMINSSVSDIGDTREKEVNTKYEIYFSDPQYIIYEKTEFTINTNQRPDNIEFILNNSNTGEKYKKSGLKTSIYSSTFTFDPNIYPEGVYELKAIVDISNQKINKSHSFVYKKIEIAEDPTVKNNSHSLEQEQSATTSDNNNTQQTPAETNQNSNNEKSEDTDKKISTTSKVVSSTKNKLDQECIEKNINDEFQCERFLRLDPYCRQNDIKTINECDIFLLLPYDCQINKITSNSDCIDYLKKSSLPRECKNSDIYDHEECANYYLKQKIPEICSNKNIDNINDCIGYLNQKNNQEKIDEQTNFCKKFNINEEDCRDFAAQTLIDKKCFDEQIYNYDKCNEYLLDTEGLSICKMVNIHDKTKCSNYLTNRFTTISNCSGGDIACRLFIENHLGIISNTQNKYENIYKFIEKTGDYSSIANIYNSIETSNNILPAKDKDRLVKLLKAKEEIKVEDGITQTPSIVLIFDSDKDGLSDDIENILGTDIQSSDSDGDGYSDLEEYQNGYNPAGRGKIFQNKQIFNYANKDLIMEHPKTNGVTINELKILKHENTDDGELKISGKAKPRKIYSLYIYSDLPLLATVYTDEQGNWEYLPKHKLHDGKHEIYLTLNNQKGEIDQKSQAYELFIKDNRAVSANEFLTIKFIETEKETKSMWGIYFLVLSLLAFGGLLFRVSYKYIKKAKQLKA